MTRAELKVNTWLEIARVFAQLSTCPRRRVGCVLTDANDYCLGLGRNGVPAGAPHCTAASPCPGFGASVTDCQAIHAEQNALAHCSRPTEIHSVYCTTEPCSECLKLLLATPAQHLYVAERYHQSQSLERWASYGRKAWVLLYREPLESV